MAWVADYTHRIDPAALKAAGVVGVCRYLSYPVPSGKVIGRAEYDELRATGIEVVLNWEFDNTDWLGGAPAGAAHGKEAARLAKALGHPAGSPIPGSADFDMTAGQWSSSCRAYAAAFRDALHAGGYAAAVYGPWDVLSRCRDLGGFAMFWQSMSTAHSGGRNANPWPGAHLRQRFQTSVAGHEVDHNDILRDDWAGDPVGTAQESSPGHIEKMVGNMFAEFRATLAAAATRDQAALTAIQALAASGTSIDTAAVIARINEVAQAESATVAALTAEVTDLKAKLAAAGHALG